jgi:hypothetical protein
MPTQPTVLKIACYLAFATSALHMVGHLAGSQAPPANDTERQLLELATNYRFPMPAGQTRSFMEFMNGFSLMFSVFLATTGGLGLMVARRGLADQPLMTAVARMLTAAYAVSTVISITHFFIIPTACLAIVTVAFAWASKPDSATA